MTKLSSIPRVLNRFNYSRLFSLAKPHPLDANGNPVSLTVPDMSLSIHEIISRFTRGLAVPKQSLSNVDGDVSMFDSLNQFEKIDMAKRLKHRVDVMTQNLNKQRADKARAKFDADVNARIDAKANELFNSKTRTDGKS